MSRCGLSGPLAGSGHVLRQAQNRLTTNGTGGPRARVPGGFVGKRAVREPPLREMGSAGMAGGEGEG